MALLFCRVLTRISPTQDRQLQAAEEQNQAAQKTAELVQRIENGVQQRKEVLQRKETERKFGSNPKTLEGVDTAKETFEDGDLPYQTFKLSFPRQGLL